MAETETVFSEYGRYYNQTASDRGVTHSRQALRLLPSVTLFDLHGL